MCKFENHVTRNDVIMTSLPKTMENADVLETKQIIYYSKGIDESHPKMYILLNLSHYVKRYGHLSQILAFFAMPALQIWPCHVTQEANFEKKLFFPNSSINIGKICKLSGRKSLYFRSYQSKTSRRVENIPPPPPVLLGLINFIHIISCVILMRNYNLIHYLNARK